MGLRFPLRSQPKTAIAHTSSNLIFGSEMCFLERKEALRLSVSYRERSRTLSRGAKEKLLRKNIQCTGCCLKTERVLELLLESLKIVVLRISRFPVRRDAGLIGEINRFDAQRFQDKSHRHKPHRPHERHDDECHDE